MLIGYFFIISILCLINILYVKKIYYYAIMLKCVCKVSDLVSDV